MTVNSWSIDFAGLVLAAMCVLLIFGVIPFVAEWVAIMLILSKSELKFTWRV